MLLPKTYARARLFLGMSGVGLFVVLSVLALWFGWPRLYLPGSDASVAHEVGALAALLGIYLLISLPLDWLGGYFLPKWYGRRSQSFERFLAGWFSGALVHGGLLLLIAIALLLAGKTGGTGRALVVVAGAMGLLLLLQERTASLVGNLRERESRGDVSRVKQLLRRWGVRPLVPVRVYASRDEGFTGGIVGLPGRERIVLPRHWFHEFDMETMALVLARRTALVREGAGRTLGVAVAFGWNLIGFALVANLVPGAGVGSVAELAALALGFTLWCFLGLLTLPSLSRYGVFAADRVAARYNSNGRLEAAVRALDKMQDDEPRRPPLVETIFHPLPSVESRLSRLATSRGSTPAGGMSPWNAARLSLYLSWAGLGLLSRAVHCNAGRPDLWVHLPVD